MDSLIFGKQLVIYTRILYEIKKAIADKERFKTTDNFELYYTQDLV